MRIVAIDCQSETVSLLTELANAHESDSRPIEVCGYASFEEAIQATGQGEEQADRPLRQRIGAIAIQKGSPALSELPEQLRQAEMNPAILGIRFEQDGSDPTFDIWDGVAAQSIEGLTRVQLMAVLEPVCDRQRKANQIRELDLMMSAKNGQIEKLADSAYRCFDHLAHEFRTPLTVIRDYAELLRDDLIGPTSKKQKEYLTTIQDRIEELSCVIDDMLDIRRAQMGVLTIRRQPTEIGPKVAAVVARLKRRAQSKDVNIDLVIPSVMPKAFCDVERLQRVIFNLILNSLKYIDAGETIRVLIDSDPQNDEIAIRVEDSFGVDTSGESLQAEERDRLLRDFTNARVGFDAGRGEVFGPGLGIAREVMRRSLGGFEIRSEPGVGTTMTVRIPTCNDRSLVSRFLADLGRSPESPKHTVLYRVRPQQFLGLDPSGVIDDFIQHAQNDFGFVMPTNGHNWLWLLSCIPSDEAQIIEGLNRRWQEIRADLSETEIPDLVIERIIAWSDRVADEVIVNSFHAAFDHLRQMEPPRPRVLLAEDDLESLAGLVARLENFGYEVTSAISSRDCLQAAMADLPDAILIDCGLGDGEGQSTYDELKQNGLTMNVPILMLADDMREQQKAMEHGARHVMGKPFDAGRLRSTLKELIATS